MRSDPGSQNMFLTEHFLSRNFDRFSSICYNIFLFARTISEAKNSKGTGACFYKNMVFAAPRSTFEENSPFTAEKIFTETKSICVLCSSCLGPIFIITRLFTWSQSVSFTFPLLDITFWSQMGIFAETVRRKYVLVMSACYVRSRIIG